MKQMHFIQRGMFLPFSPIFKMTKEIAPLTKVLLVHGKPNPFIAKNDYAKVFENQSSEINFLTKSYHPSPSEVQLIFPDDQVFGYNDDLQSNLIHITTCKPNKKTFMNVKTSLILQGKISNIDNFCYFDCYNGIFYDCNTL
jgi:hypothetical protein